MRHFDRAMHARSLRATIIPFLDRFVHPRQNDLDCTSTLKLSYV